MSQVNNITNRRRFKHLTERERYQIEILLKEKKKPKEIAKLIGKHRRTIEREIIRGTIRLLNSDLTYKKMSIVPMLLSGYTIRTQATKVRA